MSKEIRPKQRLGQVPGGKIRKAVIWLVLAVIASGGAWAAYKRFAKTVVEIPTARVRKAEFVISVRTRGEIRSTRSKIITAPQVPQPKILDLYESGKFIKAGEVVVQFDQATMETSLMDFETRLKTVDAEVIQLKASQKMTDESDSMNLMTAEYNVERSRLEASKADVVSKIEGEKSAIDVGISEGELNQVKTVINAHDVAQNADVQRLQQKKDKSVRDYDRQRGYLEKMVLRAPNDGIVNILPNFRAQGNFGGNPPPFKEGDSAWTGAEIAEIPDLSSMRIELKLDEVDRGKLQIGQLVKIRVDAIPEKEFQAELDWISPIAALSFRGGNSSEKSFPARATLKHVDPRLRPGMSASAEILIESQPNALLIETRASFAHQGKPAVYVQRNGGVFEIRPIEVGKRNEKDIIVTKGLQEGDIVALENPVEAAKRAKKI